MIFLFPSRKRFLRIIPFQREPFFVYYMLRSCIDDDGIIIIKCNKKERILHENNETNLNTCLDAAARMCG